MPATEVVPAVVFHIPHSSTHIPASARSALLLSDAALEREVVRMTDLYTDELFAVEPEVATTVMFPVSRLVVDPERFTDDAQEPMAARGMGVVYTRTSEGGVLRAEPSPEERAALLAAYYEPHHDTLTRAVDASLAAHGRCLVVDCHSFPAEARAYELDQAPSRPEICLGTDPFNTPVGLLTAARSVLIDAGFSVGVDIPYSGALVPAAYHGRDHQVSALMVEVNRGLYADEEAASRLEGFTEVQARLGRALRELLVCWDGASYHFAPRAGKSYNARQFILLDFR